MPFTEVSRKRTGVLTGSLPALGAYAITLTIPILAGKAVFTDTVEIPNLTKNDLVMVRSSDLGQSLTIQGTGPITPKAGTSAGQPNIGILPISILNNHPTAPTSSANYTLFITCFRLT